MRCSAQRASRSSRLRFEPPSERLRRPVGAHRTGRVPGLAAHRVSSPPPACPTDLCRALQPAPAIPRTRRGKPIRAVRPTPASHRRDRTTPWAARRTCPRVRSCGVSELTFWTPSARIMGTITGWHAWGVAGYRPALSWGAVPKKATGIGPWPCAPALTRKARPPCLGRWSRRAGPRRGQAGTSSRSTSCTSRSCWVPRNRSAG